MNPEGCVRCDQIKVVIIFFSFYKHDASVHFQKTSLQNQIRLQSHRRRPRRLRSPLQVDHLAAEIPRGASPASSWVKRHTTSPPDLLSSLNSSFLFSLQNKNRLIFQETSKVQQTPTFSISPSALFWYLFLESCFCTVFIVYFNRSTLCTPIFYGWKSAFAPEIRAAKQGARLILLTTTAHRKTLVLLQQHKLWAIRSYAWTQ